MIKEVIGKLVICLYYLFLKLNGLKCVLIVILNVWLIGMIDGFILCVEICLIELGVIVFLMVVCGDGVLILVDFVCECLIEIILFGFVVLIVGVCWMM